MTTIKTSHIAAIMMAVMMISCGSRTRKENAAQQISVAQVTEKPVSYTYKIVNTYAHNTSSYTQGLFWHNGYLYESTGQHGQSQMMKTELETGKVLLKRALGPKYFGEGSVILDNKIFVLTWREQIAFVLDASTFEPIKEFKYSGEGWGITTDGKRLYMSDGTNAIKILNPETFEVEKILNVNSGTNRLRLINELEWIEGEIWANVYTSDFIARIDPSTGKVLGIIDMTGILPQADIKADTDVLNGIAYDSLNKRIFVTGKNWSKLFEIEVIPKSKL